MGYCPIPGLGDDRVFSVVTGFFQYYVAGFFRHYAVTWLSVSRHGPQVRHTTRPESARQACAKGWDGHATTQCARQSFLVMCHDRDLRVATLFPGKLGGLGRDRGFLCRNRDRSTLCRDRNSVLRQGLGMSQAWVTTRVSLCRDRAWTWEGALLARKA